jgi:hypothetical protein
MLTIRFFEISRARYYLAALEPEHHKLVEPTLSVLGKPKSR